MILTIFTDGGSRGNPGPAALGVVVRSDSEVIWESSEYLGIVSNNVAEYAAVLHVLSWLSKAKEEGKLGKFAWESLVKLDFRLDSLLVVQQLRGVFKVKHPDMAEAYKKAISMLQTLKIAYSFTHIPREQNARADELVNQCLDAQLIR